MTRSCRSQILNACVSVIAEPVRSIQVHFFPSVIRPSLVRNTLHADHLASAVGMDGPPNKAARVTSGCLSLALAELEGVLVLDDDERAEMKRCRKRQHVEHNRTRHPLTTVCSQCQGQVHSKHLQFSPMSDGRMAAPSPILRDEDSSVPVRSPGGPAPGSRACPIAIPSQAPGWPGKKDGGESEVYFSIACILILMPGWGVKHATD
jgi:hypothetical protein